jgi:hypothetical protein
MHNLSKYKIGMTHYKGLASRVIFLIVFFLMIFIVGFTFIGCQSTGGGGGASSGSKDDFAIESAPKMFKEMEKEDSFSDDAL